MLINSQASPSRNPVPPGLAALQGLAIPPDGRTVEKLPSGHFCACQELFTLHVRTAGPGRAFLVAQAGWGADAGPAAQAAYGEIAQVLQDQGLTIVHERLQGRWRRPDGGYVIEIKEIDASGKMDAGYFNHQSHATFPGQKPPRKGPRPEYSSNYGIRTVRVLPIP